MADMLITKVLYGSPLTPRREAADPEYKNKIFMCKENITDHISCHLSMTGDRHFVGMLVNDIKGEKLVLSWARSLYPIEMENRACLVMLILAAHPHTTPQLPSRNLKQLLEL